MDSKIRESCAAYIIKCRKVLKEKDVDEARKLRLAATKQFHDVIPAWESGLMASITHFYLDDIESILAKLVRLKARLDLGYDIDAIISDPKSGDIVSCWDARLQRNIMVDSFADTYLWILENYASNNAEMIDIFEKVRELQYIANQPASKGQRWERLKVILDWIESKNVDLASQILPLVTNIICD